MGIFSDDYAHFESNHADFPEDAKRVFAHLDELRSVLAEFRKATESKIDEEDKALVTKVVAEEVPSTLCVAESSITEPTLEKPTIEGPMPSAQQEDLTE